MSRRRRIILLSVLAGLLAACAAGYALRPGVPSLRDAAPAGREARIRPDYSRTVIPPNIAPLNFQVLEPGRRYYVRVSSARGQAIHVQSGSPGIVIPLRPWRRLLAENRGQDLVFDLCVQGDDGRWTRFGPIVNRIAAEGIDSHLVYRLIRPLYNIYRNVGIYQRDLSSYDESVVLHGRSFSNGCVNCHTFLRHGAEDMLLHIRGRRGVAMLLARGGQVRKIDTRTQYNPSPAAYSCWHPSGRLIAFSVNKLRIYTHSVGETREVFDHASDLGVYVTAANAVKSTGQISRPERLETFPNWSPDGRHLYYCSAPETPLSGYRDVRYDLMRIGYDVKTDTWGQAETVLSARQTGRSITQPRVSPDGRFLMFCMSDYGSFPIYQAGSDLYLMDLRTRRYRRLAVNSDRCESWHCWSSTGRWFVFSSKRSDGLFARPYLSYFDAASLEHKPFLLPQKDPAFYDSFVWTYNVPELVRGPVRLRPEDFLRAIDAPGGAEDAVAISGATPKIIEEPDESP